MRTNQRGEEVQEHVLWQEDLNPGEAEALLFVLLDHLNLIAVRTNATKHGNTELQLRPRDS